jgi:hypothetical protein
VAHGASFGAHAQRFDDGELAVLGNADVRIEGLDDFGGKDMAGGGSPPSNTANRKSLLIAAPDSN